MEVHWSTSTIIQMLYKRVSVSPHTICKMKFSDKNKACFWSAALSGTLTRPTQIIIMMIINKCESLI
ncbi:hypothetical protein VNO78_20268 [Psophocarpus tetragonolobus]|uniref:Uncharacterized protein n=1 Tax=Psophocarpus tetragonolobus TaxID=3891 RepID=A0AAN9SA07_PSOTE